MSTIPSHDAPAIFWIDGAGQQQGPESLATVIERIAYDQIPASTPVWWQGAVNWAPFDSNDELRTALQARLAPAPAFQSPSTFESPATFEAPATFQSPTFDSPTQAQPVAAAATSVFAAPATFDAPAPDESAANPIAVSFDAPSADVAPVTATDRPDVPDVILPAAGSPFSSSLSPNGSDVHAAAPFDVIVEAEPEPEPEPEPTPALRLGDPSELAATFAMLTERTAAADAERERAAALDGTLESTVRHALGDLGFTVEEALTSEEYHSFRLTAPDGSGASLAIQRVPAAYTVAAATEHPVACFVDHGGRASAGLYLGDYLGDSDGLDAELFGRHLAAIVQAAGAA